MAAEIVEAEENFLIDLQFLVEDLIAVKKVSRADLAKKAGISESRLSQILSAEANPTARTFARVFHALGVRVKVEEAPERRDVHLPPSLDVNDEWQLETDQESSDSRKVKSKARVEALLKQWREASNDNYVSLSSDENSVRLKAA